jgi:hypothetical protein
MKQLVLLTLAATLFAETGVRPQPSASDYAAHQDGKGVTLGATVLTQDQAKKVFAVDLNKLGYTVVEVAVYPDRDVEVATRDFIFRDPKDGSTVRPAAPSTIAGKLGRKESPSIPKIPENTQVYGSETIGYESGPYRRGVYTASTVGVAHGEPGPTPPPAPPKTSKGKDTDSLSVQVDLENQALPEGRVSKPVAGYLYFPATPKKGTAVEITWYGEDGQVRLQMPPTK